MADKSARGDREEEVGDPEPTRQMLQEFWSLAQSEVERDFHRTLPFADYVVDRWEKARRLGFGEGASVYDSSLVIGDVTIGEHTWIGPYTVLDGSGGLQIGSFCSISAGVQIYTHDTIEWALSGGVRPVRRAPTRIGSRCYLGPNVVVTSGVTIGDGCLVGANSLVLDDIPDGYKAYGTPCRLIAPVDLPSGGEGEAP